MPKKTPSKAKKVDNLGPIQRKWVEALRAGAFKQMRLTMSREIGGEMCFDVMGVLCEVTGTSRELEKTVSGYNRYVYKDRKTNSEARHIIPDSVVEEAGLFSRDAILDHPVKIDGNVVTTLMGANDRGLSFKELADLIEKNHKSLFKEKK